MPQSVASTLQNGTNAILSMDPGTLQQLNNLVPSVEALKQAGYVVKKLTDVDLEQKKRCLACGVRVKKRPPRVRKHDKPQLAGGGQHPGASPALESEMPRNVDGAPPKLLLRCNFHSGIVVNKMWTCCRRYVTAAPCKGQEHHEMQVTDNLVRLELEQRFQLHATPPVIRPSHRLAVALDCEMGTAFDGDSELIRITVIDFFTGEPLIDSLVYPDIKMAHFNTRWSGVTRSDMEQSRRQGRCLFGRDGARRALFKHVGPSTIVVGHGAQNDLSSLRWIHHRVVDSYMVESAVRKEAKLKAEQKKKEEEKEKGADEPKEVDKPKEGGPKDGRRRDKHHPDGMSLKALAMKRLGRTIQVGKKGHDSLEDALAARDLIQAHIMGIGGSDA